MNEREQSTSERIAAAAREHYNAPAGPTPRDEMWDAIEARLDAAAVDESGGIIPLRVGSTNREHRRYGWWIGIAAALAIGLGLGRLSSVFAPAPTNVAEQPVDSGPVLAETPAGLPSPEAEDTTLEQAAPGDGLPRNADESDGRGRESAEVSPGLPGLETATPAEPRNTTLAYDAAARRHLGKSESFLTAVRADLETGSTDSDIVPWARSLLSRTRLLMGSPAGRDPDTRRLLEDLELMLTQIVVTTGAEDAGDARIVGDQLEEGSLLFRLRSAADGSRTDTGALGPSAASL